MTLMKREIEIYTEIYRTVKDMQCSYIPHLMVHYMAVWGGNHLMIV